MECNGPTWVDVNATEFYLASPEQFEVVLEHRFNNFLQGYQFTVDNAQVEVFANVSSSQSVAFNVTSKQYEILQIGRTVYFSTSLSCLHLASKKCKAYSAVHRACYYLEMQRASTVPFRK